jgi:cation:H+ antiporter
MLAPALSQVNPPLPGGPHAASYRAAGWAVFATIGRAVALLTLVLFLVGLVLLVFGANALVRGAADLAAAFGTPPLIIGLTVVAFGTSSPETLVSLQAAAAGQPQIALGNVIGSNIFNILFILGLSALIAPLQVSAQLVRIDVPVMIGFSVLVLLLSLNGRISTAEGALLIAGIITYTLLLIRLAKRGRVEVRIEPGLAPTPGASTWRNIGRIVLGLALLTLGARWLVGSATEFARAVGVSDLVIGLTIVAGGTSLPEVATSIAATVRGERDIAVGNVVGSNIFNLMLVLGSAALVGSGGMVVPPAALTFDLPVMTAVAVACLPIFFSGYTIARWEGAVFLAYYLAYITFLVLDATRHDAAPVFAGIMLSFVLPITVLTSVLIWVRQRRAARRDRG